MKRANTRVILAATAILAGWACGCDNVAPTVSGSVEETTVTGTITYKGKPVTRGQVIFDPANINRKNALARTTEVGKDGSYTVKTLVGENMVVMSDPMFRKLFVVKAGGDTISFDVDPNQIQAGNNPR
jgi:hypothetical protein